MKWIKNYKIFKESKQEGTTYSNKNLVQEICTSMVLINSEFLDNILDRGLKARYSEDSSVFLNDLKNMLMSKNRLNLGRFEDGKCVVDDEFSKVNGFFNDVEFSIEKDWDKLSNSRTTARNIIDKLIPDEKLSEERVRYVFWIGPNKDKEHNEDIVIELNDGKQYSLFLNKNLSNTRTSKMFVFLHALHTMEKNEDVHLFLAETTARKVDLRDSIKTFDKKETSFYQWNISKNLLPF
jgi:hypothetical protein